ncbi:YTH domain-containing protein [Plasmodium gonderi]|uniref:YTH domain-containing protein n=1 Tax=Plasmodium gonderi TaxID=77519 RepID=A0A1Y1JJU5_PLAGO|nr:YTH domain-containing protein [Plasmodium gonderi]GAW80723.1 YTH domain-containing protein [Plasmodium gonderi]
MHIHKSIYIAQIYTSNFSRVKFFLIKSSSDKNISISLNFNIWATTPKNENKFVSAFVENDYVVLVFSVNGSSKFCGYAIMKSMPGESKNSNVYFYYDDKIFRGRNFDIQWVRVVDVPFQEVSHLKNSLNENKSIKVGRDGQEIEHMIGLKLCEIFEAKYAKMSNFGELKTQQTNQVGQATHQTQPKQTTQMTQPSQSTQRRQRAQENLDSGTSGGKEKIDMVKLFPPNSTLNINYNTFKKMYEESQYNLVNIYNPALHIFPVDLTNMNYDEYIDLYEKSQLAWQEKIQQLQQFR